MSQPYHYHQPNAPDSHGDDQDSDLELDLQELDPISSSPAGPSRSARPSQDARRKPFGEFGGRIPLRNLRVGRLRRGGDYGQLNRRDEEDRKGLLNEDDSNRHSGGSGDTGDDDAPLLGAPRQRRMSIREKTFLEKIGRFLHIPGLVDSEYNAPGDEDDADAEHDPSSNRTIAVGQRQTTRFPPNAISNAKYTPWSFLPKTLYNEFSFFINMYFLLIALSQIIPALQVGYLLTYILPLSFVVSVTMAKEAVDDVARRRRDAEANSEPYTVMRFEERDGTNGSASSKSKKSKKNKANGKAAHRPSSYHEEEQGLGIRVEESRFISREITKRSSELKVGDVLKLGKDRRVPADVIVLQSTSKEFAGDKAAIKEEHENLESLVEADDGPAEEEIAAETNGAGEAFIKTDQLDGETDWKLRLATPLTQTLDVREFPRLRIVAGKPDRKVNEFIGTVELLPKDADGTATGTPEDSGIDTSKSAPLSIDNTAWANTVLASSSTVYAVVIYTGSQTRQALSTSQARSKTGLLEYEINSLIKILCVLVLTLSFILVALEGFEIHDGRTWYISVMRYLILFSTIVPVSLRVNLDMGKTVYAFYIQHDKDIPGTIVRTSTIPEDLGRIEYLLSDKTGTLTQNEMELKKVHVGTVSYANEAMEEVSTYTRQAFATPDEQTLVTPSSAYVAPSTSATRTRREIGARVRDLVLALALCHNVTPTAEEIDGESVTTYQASSPDEIAIVKWTELVGLRLLRRDRMSMTLQSVHTGRTVVRVKILTVFPFTSEGKRMGIIVQFESSNGSDDDREIWFFQKGADTVMSSIVAANDWLEEETANMAREGLRTLVVGRRRLSGQQFDDFSNRYAQANLALQGRDAAMAEIVTQFLERDLELLGVTGVEDKLQKDVKPSLELLRNAGIKIWMLTGDKVETARCVAVSSKLVSRGQFVHTIAKMKRKDLANSSLDFLRSNPSAALLIDGESLSLMLTHYRETFISLAVRLPAVIACRCSPTQKADVAKLIRAHTKKRVACIGDGGNDVSMIQAADVGVGIVGKEGRQASLAADFSIEQFCYLTKLLVWHGRNSYKRSAKLAQFVIHRGLIISVCQAMYSIATFEPIALYRDWLLVGYATIYTMAPVFSLVLDRDVDESLVNIYPELYKELTTGRSLSYKTFFIWVFVSIYQGSMIQGLSELLIGVTDNSFKRMVAVSYTALILNEIIMVAVEITTWHPVMIFCIVGTAAGYFGSVPFLRDYYDLEFMIKGGFWWRLALIMAISLVPPYAGKLLGRTLRPPSYRKVRGV
ncbi:phospholipid-translocating P-type ATPase-like protein [Rhizodiscina lignyota]|uniref:Phospholipid-transporting ATPase n=1 Tax=Rhizodiscina lignyota TaxID=1504668 RepID=A0A9P4ID31_9PEZI|nr:phospholipid-translocating P-type ATPase-like protein [Rhizodiscina lignyota]